MAGAPPGGGAPFDLSALSSVLNDPAIRGMAESIAQDPTFAQLTATLQESLLGGGAGAGGAAAGAAAGAGDGLPAGLDPSKYAEAMSSVMGNPGFMQMAESLGKQIMESDPGMASLMQSMHNPAAQANIESKLAALKDDPELAPVLAEIETGGPAAMMKYWNDPAVLEKLSSAMGGAFGALGGGGGGGGDVIGAPPGDDDEAGADAEGEPTVHTAASAGDVDTLKDLLAGGAPADDADDEGRTALHFSAGYGETACVLALLDAGAALERADGNDNTPLHYAAGYGQPAVVRLLLERGADATASNRDGKTPREVAALNGADDIVAMFDSGDGAKEEEEEGKAVAAE